MIENFEHCARGRCGAMAAIKSDERSKTWRTLGLLAPSSHYYNSSLRSRQENQYVADLCPACCDKFQTWWEAGQEIQHPRKHLKLLPSAVEKGEEEF